MLVISEIRLVARFPLITVATDFAKVLDVYFLIAFLSGTLQSERKMADAVILRFIAEAGKLVGCLSRELFRFFRSTFGSIGAAAFHGRAYVFVDFW
jgi:hypothetical protein